MRLKLRTTFSPTKDPEISSHSLAAFPSAALESPDTVLNQSHCFSEATLADSTSTTYFNDFHSPSKTPGAASPDHEFLTCF